MDVLFLPGYACRSDIWEPLRAWLPARYALTLLDWPRQLTLSFHCLGLFAKWLSDSLAGRRFDCVVGHSMGGLVALQAAAGLGSLAAGRVVLVESFLTPPGPFFRNLVLVEESPEAFAMRAMLRAEKQYFHPALAESLRNLDMCEPVARASMPVDAIHGDRGCGDAERVKSQLGWPSWLRERVDLTVVPNACHFPMVENPHATATALCSILG